MIAKLILLASATSVVALILASAWLTSRGAYIAILVLVAVMLVAGDSHWPVAGAANLGLVVAVDLLLFGVVFYFVTVQWLLQRRVTQLTTRDEFRQLLTEQGRFNGFARFVYHLPLFLVVAMILVAIVGSWMSPS